MRSMAFTLEVEDLAQLKRLLALVRDIAGVESAPRAPAGIRSRQPGFVPGRCFG